MKKIIISAFKLCLLGLFLSSCQPKPTAGNQQDTVLESNWQQRLKTSLPLLGHRNWILIVDKAYPAPSSANITVINTGQNLPEVAKQLDSLLKTQDHIRPIVYQDKELAYIDEQLVPGIDMFKKEIGLIFRSGLQVIPHTSIFQKIEDASKLFHVVVLKTASTLPYTSLFIELDCKYWNANSEQELRRRMQHDSNRHEPLITKRSK
ncbi:MAG: hypothetical protein ACN6O7_03970 [Sphingobacterium sp.]